MQEINREIGLENVVRTGSIVGAAEDAGEEKGDFMDEKSNARHFEEQV